MDYKYQALIFTRFPNETMKYLLDIVVKSIREKHDAY